MFCLRKSGWQKTAVGVLSIVAVTTGAVTAGLAAPAANAALDAQDQRVAALLTRAIRNRVSSPGGKLQLTVRPTARSGQGYFSEIYVAGRPAKIRKLRITELRLRARNVRVDVPHLMSEGKVRTLASNTSLHAVVTENDLTSMLAQGKHTKTMGLRVKYIGGDKMQVTGNLNWTLINGPVKGIGRLRLAPGYKVNLEILSLKLRGHEVPQFVKNQFSQRINPVIDYEDVPFRPHFRGLKVQGSRAILTA